jgi:diguanylate cyclase (GGDEF)-like protein
MLIASIMVQYFNAGKIMQNEEIKSLVTKLYDNVLNLIDSQKETSKEQVIHYLQDAIKTVETIKNDDIKSAKLIFEDPYKEIATSSLNSYQSTSSKFKKISELHKKTLNDCENNHIDLPSLTKKFGEIQQHMSSEVTKANQIIFQLSSQVKELEKTSSIDALTKILNRRALDIYLEKLCKTENQENVHLLILDVDDFKKVNDTYGHLAGDKILIYLANILKKALRDEDRIFRYGGEEFVIILHNVDNEKCKTTSTRLLELVRKSKLIYKGTNLSVTISIGTTPYYKNDSPEMLLTRADKALYAAKNSGKDKICSEI